MCMRIVLGLALAATCLSNAPAPAQLADCRPSRAAFAALRDRVLHPADGHVIVVAHRACFAAAPENSPEAIDACWRMGVEVVENDVRSTKDGALVVMHDDTVNRTTDGWGYLDDLTWTDLSRLHLRDGEGGPGAAVTPMPVTTLRAYYRAAKDKVMINLELKPSAIASYDVLLAKSLKIAAEEGVLDQILLKVPDKKNHGKVAARHRIADITVPKGVITWPMIWESDGMDPAARVTELEPYGPGGYEVPFLTPAFFGAIANDPRLKGRPVMAVAVQPYWSGGLSDAVSLPNPDAGWGRLIALGANVLMTDHPEYLLRYLEKTGHRRPLGGARCGG